MSVYFTVEQAFEAGHERTSFFYNVTLPFLQAFLIGLEIPNLMSECSVNEVTSTLVNYQYAYQLPNDSLYVVAVSDGGNNEAEIVYRATAESAAMAEYMQAVVKDGVLYTHVEVKGLAYFPKFVSSTPISLLLYELFQYQFAFMWAQRSGYMNQLQTFADSLREAKANVRNIMQKANTLSTLSFQITDSNQFSISQG